MAGKQAFVLDKLYTVGLRNVIGKREGRTSEEIEVVLAAEKGAIPVGVDRFSQQILDGRFFGGEAIQFSGDGPGHVRVDGPSAAGRSTNEGKERSRCGIRLTCRKDATGIVEDEECVEVETQNAHVQPTLHMHGWMLTKRVQNSTQIHQFLGMG